MHIPHYSGETWAGREQTAEPTQHLFCYFVSKTFPLLRSLSLGKRRCAVLTSSMAKLVRWLQLQVVSLSVLF